MAVIPPARSEIMVSRLSVRVRSSSVIRTATTKRIADRMGLRGISTTVTGAAIGAVCLLALSSSRCTGACSASPAEPDHPSLSRRHGPQCGGGPGLGLHGV